MDDEQKKTEEFEGTPIPIERSIPSEMRTNFANHFVIRHSIDGDEFEVDFFELMQPIVLENEPLPELKKVTAHCVARITLTREKMGRFIAACAGNFAKCMQRLDEKKKHPETEQDADEKSLTEEASNEQKHAG